MLAVCMRYTRHRMEAEDIIQEAFIKVFDNIEKFAFRGSFEGWIRTIVVNTALKKCSKKSFKNEQIGLINAPDLSADPEIFAQMNAQELLNLIEQLPDGYRIVFNLYVIDGYSHKEIAEMLGVGESTSRSQLVKARKMLQRQVLEMQKIAI